jgi:hypothetical protein
MKIRMRHNHQQTVQATSRDDFGTYGWFQNGSLDGQVILYSRHDWEPVPEEKWEPALVTITDRTLTVASYPQWVYHVPKGYRFREVAVFDALVDGGSAFIIERNVS